MKIYAAIDTESQLTSHKLIDVSINSVDLYLKYPNEFKVLSFDVPIIIYSRLSSNKDLTLEAISCIVSQHSKLFDTPLLYTEFLCSIIEA